MLDLDGRSSNVPMELGLQKRDSEDEEVKEMKPMKISDNNTDFDSNNDVGSDDDLSNVD